MGNQGQWRSFRVEHREGSPGVWVGFSFVTLGEVLNFLGLSFHSKPPSLVQRIPRVCWEHSLTSALTPEVPFLDHASRPALWRGLGQRFREQRAGYRRLVSLRPPPWPGPMVASEVAGFAPAQCGA